MKIQLQILEYIILLVKLLKSNYFRYLKILTPLKLVHITLYVRWKIERGCWCRTAVLCSHYIEVNSLPPGRWGQSSHVCVHVDSSYFLYRGLLRTGFSICHYYLLSFFQNRYLVCVFSMFIVCSVFINEHSPVASSVFHFILLRWISLWILHSSCFSTLCYDNSTLGYLAIIITHL